MAARAEGTFTVTSWEEETYQELDGKAKLTKASVGYRLTGDIEGDAIWPVRYCRPVNSAVPSSR